mgnify:CR=1 FL=1
MSKIYGLVSIHAKTINEFMETNEIPLGARHLIEIIKNWDNLDLEELEKRSPPSRRQVGIYLKLNPNYTLVENSTHGRLYLYSERI